MCLFIKAFNFRLTDLQSNYSIYFKLDFRGRNPAACNAGILFFDIKSAGGQIFKFEFPAKYNTRLAPADLFGSIPGFIKMSRNKCIYSQHHLPKDFRIVGIIPGFGKDGKKSVKIP